MFSYINFDGYSAGTKFANDLKHCSANGKKEAELHSHEMDLYAKLVN